MPDSPENRIGPYRIVRRLGAGGMGEVFLGYDERLDRLVAIKRVRSEAVLDPSRRERLRREARAAARLSHSNVVQVFDLEEDEEGSDAIVLEYVQGKTIAELLRGGPLPVEQAIELAAQVADGLAAAHAAGLIHRDLKAENVVVTEDGRAKILDFGLVKPLDPGADSTLTEHGAVLGTYRAMAPEQAEGEEVDARSDLFSLGVLLYEMLTGRSPFQGATPVATLRNLTGAAPRPLEEVREDLPVELVELVHALLEKEPEKRPAGAREVLGALRLLVGAGSGGGEGGKPALSRADSSLPGRVSLPPTHPNPPLQEATSAWRRNPGVRVPAAVALLVVLAIAVWLVAGPVLARQPLRVAVPKPVLAPGAEGLDLAASGASVAALRSLLSLRDLSPIDPAQIGDIEGPPIAVARAVAADEVLTMTLQGKGRSGDLSLQRVRTADGTVIWAERLPVPLGPEDGLVLAEAVSAALRRAYADREIRTGSPDLEVRAADWTEFLRIKQRLDAGRSAWAPELERLETVLAGSPRFFEGHLQAGSLAISLYDDTKKPAYLERAEHSLERARAIDSSSPRLLAVEIRLALTEQRWTRAEELLSDLESASPGDVTVAVQRSRLAEAQGRLEEAVALLREVVARRPAWRDLMRLAELEARRGQVDPARRALEQVLELVPGNGWALSKLGELELLFGDPRRAAEIYRRLIAAGAQRSDHTNLGLSLALLGDFEGAARSYRKALEIAPGHRAVMLNLADAELALGRTAEARSLYQQVLADLEAARPSGLHPVDRTVEAQCLVRLGRTREAVALALETLQQYPEEGEVAYQAALVLCLAGEDASALAIARKALALGIQPRWFGLPGFERLRADPLFRELPAAAD